MLPVIVAVAATLAAVAALLVLWFLLTIDLFAPQRAEVSGWRRYGGWALVTGASSGIGRAFAEQIASAGVSVVLVARRRERLEELAARLRETHGVEALVVPQDLSVPGASARVWEAVGDREVGILVCNAGFAATGPLDEIEPKTLADLVMVSCLAYTELTRLALPAMVARGNGAVVYVSALGGDIPAGGIGLYAGAKAFALRLAQSLFAENTRRGVHVIAVQPGKTRSEIFESAIGLSAASLSEGTRSRLERIGAEKDARTGEDVAMTALANLGKRASIVDGRSNRLIVGVARLMNPTALVKRVNFLGLGEAGD